MIKQLVFTLFLLFSLSFFSSCSIFGGGDSEESAEGEDYYSEEGMDEEEVEEPEEEMEEEEEAQYEESQEDESGDEEDVYYIDEEDEDILEAEEGENIEIEDTSVADAGENYDSGGESSSFFSDQKASAPSGPVTTPATKKQWIPYKKIKSQAYSAAGFVVNAAYIARSGEDIQSISNTIFGSDQVSQLYAINPHLKARSVKVGDKIYYQSPNRPQDSSQLLFYFEDRGIQPSYHQIQAGENIRKIASQLLGHAESWKEIWATNPDLQSKGRLDQPVTIKYWSADAVGGGAAEPTLPPPPPQPEQPVGQQEEEKPPSPEDMNPPPSMGETQEMPEEPEESPPLPPSPEESIIPPEPSSEGDKTRSFSQVDMALAGILALVALICAFIIIKKRMNKKKDFDYTATNFEIDE